MKPVVEIARIGDENSEAVADFFRKVWDPDATGDRVRRARAEAALQNPAVRGADVPAVIYLRDRVAVGHLGTVPVKFWNGRIEEPAHLLKGFMVLPAYQNGPVGFAVLKEILKHVDVCGAMVVALPARRLFQAMGFADCGAIPNYIRVLRPGRVARFIDIAALGLGFPNWLRYGARAMQISGLASIAGTIAGAAVRARHVSLPRWSKPIVTDLSGNLPSQRALDDFWVRIRPSLAGAVVRDASFMSWRYHARAGATYEAVAVHEREEKNRLVAIAIVRRCGSQTDARLRGIRVATLADILFLPEDPEAGVAALAGADEVARRMGADAILCSSAHPAIILALRRKAYLRLPGNVHFMLRDPTNKLGLPLTVEGWWLTRGDGNSDEAF